MDSTVVNANLRQLPEDRLHHLGFNVGYNGCEPNCRDIKFVCVAGSAGRIMKFSHFLWKEMRAAGLPVDDQPPENICTTDRYVLFKIGPVLACSHGIGQPSLSIVLHEIFKLLHYSGAEDVVFLRLGTSGGYNVPVNSVVITLKALNGLLEPFYELDVLGERLKFDATLDLELAEDIAHTFKESGSPLAKKGCNVFIGNTVTANDFYEGQARIDGALCCFSSEKKQAFFDRLKAAGVLNFEMEATCLAAMCRRANFKAAVICVTLVDRSVSDQITLSAEQNQECQDYPQIVAAIYIIKRLSI